MHLKTSTQANKKSSLGEQPRDGQREPSPRTAAEQQTARTLTPSQAHSAQDDLQASGQARCRGAAVSESWRERVQYP